MTKAPEELSIEQLKQALSIREKIEHLQRQLDGVISVRRKPGRPKSVGAIEAAVDQGSTKPKRRMSKGARAKMAAAAKKRWAAAKAAGKKRL